MSTPIVDAQVHAYERDHPGRPWTDVLVGPSEVTGDQMIAAMDEVGVDGAILVSVHTMYRFDPSYAIEVQAAHPDRFAMVKPVDPADPGVEQTIADWVQTSGAVAIRIMMRADEQQPSRSAGDDPGFARIFTAAANHGLPINLLCWGRLGEVATLLGRYPNTRVVIDHLGVSQPFTPPPPENPWAALDGVLDLAMFDNVAIKVTGGCTLALEPFPYPDIWSPLERLFERFGLDRCIWGTDWTRAVELLTYDQGVRAFTETKRLSVDDKATLMGGTLQKVYGWSPTGRAPR